MSSEKNICVLDLLGIQRPLPDRSCLSAQQIDMLFKLFLQFLEEVFSNSMGPEKAKQEVQRQFGFAATIQHKYNIMHLDPLPGDIGQKPALRANERAWIMDEVQDPPPFIAYLRQNVQVLTNLRKSFKPDLFGQKEIESVDFFNLIKERYQFWLNDDRNRRFQILFLADQPALPGKVPQEMIQRLADNFLDYRFHIAIMNNHMHWTAFLIDRHEKTMEYYDPLGFPLDLSTPGKNGVADQVLALISTVAKLTDGDKDWQQLGLHNIRHGIHQRGNVECGMYVILYLHHRLAQQGKFENFANQRISDEECGRLRRIFFRIPEKHKEDSNEDLYHVSADSSEYDVRLAAILFAFYVKEVADLTQPSTEQTELTQDANKLIDLSRSTLSAETIFKQARIFQSRVVYVLPPQFKEFAGTDIWDKILRELQSDKLTHHLRTIRSHGNHKKRRSAKAATHLVNRIYVQLMEWTKDFRYSAMVRLFETYVQGQINHYYVPALQFSTRTKSKYTKDMGTFEFLKNTMSQKETVSFGVHLLREMNAWIILNAGQAFQVNLVPSVILEKDYPQKSTLVRPQNMTTIEATVNTCNGLIEKAKKLLHMTVQNDLQVTPFQNSPTLTGLTAQTLNMASVSLTPPVDQKKLDQFCKLNEMDIRGRRFLDNGLQPWNFPLNVPAFSVSLPEVNLPAQFTLSSLTPAEIKTLLNKPEDQFLLYYALGVMVVNNAIVSGKITLAQKQIVQVMTVSLTQFFEQTDQGSPVQLILCTLLERVHDALSRSSDSQLASALPRVKPFLDRFVQTCKASNMVQPTNSFFKKMDQVHQQILNDPSFR